MGAERSAETWLPAVEWLPLPLRTWAEAGRTQKPIRRVAATGFQPMGTFPGLLDALYSCFVSMSSPVVQIPGPRGIRTRALGGGTLFSRWRFPPGERLCYNHEAL